MTVYGPTFFYFFIRNGNIVEELVVSVGEQSVVDVLVEAVESIVEALGVEVPEVWGSESLPRYRWVGGRPRKK